MANKKFNRIALHPIENGIQDPTTDLLSKTSVNSILSGTVDAVDPDGEPTTFDAGYAEDIKYDKVEKEIVPELIDNQEYPILMENIETIIPSDAKDNDGIATDKRDYWLGYYSLNEEMCINYYDDSDSGFDLYYSPTAKKWLNDDGTDYEGEDLTFVLDENEIINKDVLCEVLGLKPQIIEVDRTLKEKNEDLPNWKFGTTEKTVVITPELVNGTTYDFPQEYNIYNDFTPDDFNGSGPIYDYNNIDQNIEDILLLTMQPVDETNYPAIVYQKLDISSETPTPIIIYAYSYFYNEVTDEYEFNWYYMNAETGGNPIRYDFETQGPISIDLYLDGIEDHQEELVKKVLKLLPYEEQVIISQTLKENLDNYKNWTYEEVQEEVSIALENGKSYRPKMSFKSTDLPLDSGWCTIYSDQENNIVIEMYNGRDSSYLNYYNNIAYTYDTELNAWSYYDSVQSKQVIITDKTQLPELLYDSNCLDSYFGSYINTILDLTALVNKKVTLDEKINEPLKDKIYDKVQTELENGKEYPLSNNYDDFFEKYGQGESKLFYGNPSNNGSNNGLNIIDDNYEPGNASLLSTGEESGLTRDGAVSLNDDVVSAEMPIITGIYLVTGVSPLNNGDSGEGEISAQPSLQAVNSDTIGVEAVLGQCIIELHTTQGTLLFYQDDNSWYYGKQAIPLQGVPPLVLDETLIQDADMLKDFLHLENYSQTLAEKFKEVESKIGSAVDNTPLKDKIYDNTIELEDGQEYTVDSDMSDFFERYSSAPYTLIYGSSQSGGGDMPLPTYDSSVSPKSGTKGGEALLEPSYPSYPSSNEDPEIIIGIYYVTTVSPGEKDPVIKSNSRALGESFVQLRTSYYNYYYYYATGNSWVDEQDNAVAVADMPKLVLNTAYIQNFEMLTNVLQTIPQTLEAKLSEGIATWNYKLGEIKSTPNYAPLFDPAQVIMSNEDTFGYAGLFNEQFRTLLYESEGTIIYYAFDPEEATMYFEYRFRFETDPSIVYVFVYTLPLENPQTATWEYTVEGASISGDYTIYSQDDLPIIEDYSLSNIKSGFEDVVPLLLTELYDREPNTTLEQKIKDIKNWEYDNIPATTIIKNPIDWSLLPSASEIDNDINIYYDDSRSWYNSLVIKPYPWAESEAGNCLIFTDASLVNAGKGPELEYRNYRNTYTNTQTGSTAEAGKWYLYETVNNGTNYHAVKFTEVTPSFNFDSQYIMEGMESLYNAIVETTEGKEYKVKDKIDELLKDKAYDNTLQERLVTDAVYNLKTELETGDGTNLISLGAGCTSINSDSSYRHYMYSCVIDGYIIDTSESNEWYYLDDSDTWRLIEHIEIINGSADINDTYNKRISSDSIYTFNNKAYLFHGTMASNGYYIPGYDADNNLMYYEIEFDPSISTITLTGHIITVSGTLGDSYFYASNLFEFNDALIYRDGSSNQRVLFEIDLENDTATSGVYKSYKCRYNGTTFVEIFAEDSLEIIYPGRHVVTPINGIDLIPGKTYGGDSSCMFKVRHATSAEVAQYPDLNLDEDYSVIYDLVDPSSIGCGISDSTIRGYVTDGRFTYVNNGTTYLGSLYTKHQNYDYTYYTYKYNTSTNRWTSITLNKVPGYNILGSGDYAGIRFLFNPRTSKTYYIANQQFVYEITGLENNQLNYTLVNIHGTGDIYYNKKAKDTEISKLSCEYSTDASSYIVKLHINYNNEDTVIAYCDGADYWKDIDTDQQIDLSMLTIQNSKSYLDYHTDSRLIEIVANLIIPTPFTLEEKLDSISQFPACPTDTDGTYVLEATVSSGEVTYTWVLKSS